MDKFMSVLVFLGVLGCPLIGYLCFMDIYNRMCKTWVYVRTTKCPAVSKKKMVKYDVLGQPYVDGAHKDYATAQLFPDGETEETRMYGTVWKHKSGPRDDGICQARD